MEIIMKNFIEKDYDGVCPDCFNDNIKELKHEESCPNCGHVFYDDKLIDESLIDIKN